MNTKPTENEPDELVPAKKGTMRKFGNDQRGCSAFTLIELLVVIAIVAVLAALLFNGITRGKRQAYRIVCINNEKQLCLAWQLYADDNNGALVDNTAWVGNDLVYAFEVDPDIMRDPTKSSFAQYIKSVAIYKDPASKNTTRTGDSAPAEKSLPRSYALNCWVGPAKRREVMHQKLAPAGECQQFKKITDIGSPCPSLLFTFVDVHPDSICSPCFGVFVTPPRGERIWHYPGSYHDGKAMVSYADAHIESHKWVDPRTSGSTLEYHFGSDGHNHSSPYNADMVWLATHATSLKH